jgi:uncharacterized protein (TIGR02677 family)
VVQVTTFPTVPADLFRFTTAPNAELHTAVLHAFGEANERLEIALTLDDVHHELRKGHRPVSDEELKNALDSLRQWGLVDTVQHHATHPTTAAEYERQNLHYVLTRPGEAAVAAAKHALKIMSSTGALDTTRLDAIADRLEELHTTETRTYAALMELEGHLDAFQTDVQLFRGELQRLQTADRDTVDYLQKFVSDLDARKQRIRRALTKLTQEDVHERALGDADVRDERQWRQEREDRWRTLEAWFDGPRIDELEDIVRTAIIDLLRALDRLSEQRRKPTNTAADFRALAGWFARTSSDDEAHELFNAAFGLWPARHAHLQHADGELIPSAEPWHNTPAVPVSPQLRRTGRQAPPARFATSSRSAGRARSRRSANGTSWSSRGSSCRPTGRSGSPACRSSTTTRSTGCSTWSAGRSGPCRTAPAPVPPPPVTAGCTSGCATPAGGRRSPRRGVR